MSEEIKEIPGFNGKYLINTSGEVYSNSHKKWLKSFLNNGYVHYHLQSPEKKGLNRKAHRLVMETFIGKSELVVNHINGIIQDNRLENLEYCTQKENVRHQNYVLKRGASANGVSTRRLFSDEEILTIFTMKDTPNFVLVKHYGCHKDTIGLIRRGKTYKYIFDAVFKDSKPKFVKCDKYGNIKNNNL